MDQASPAKLYCLLVGAVLVIAGIIGFFYEASFAPGDEVVAKKVFGLLAVNGWHNVVHIAIGALLLVAAENASRPAALFVGGLYIALALLGFVATGGDGIGFVADNGTLFDLVPVNTDDNWLHVILGVTGLLAGFASGAGRPAPSSA
jgi:hypothetical protein